MAYRYPRGESYYDVINRVEPYICDLESNKNPFIVISHNATLRCLYGYFALLKIDQICNIEMPLHTVIKITPMTYGYKEERYFFNITDGTYKKIALTKDHIDRVRSYRQRLSFDLDDLESSKN